MTSTILARTTRGTEFLYSRNKAVEIPAGWTGANLENFIDNLNKHFKLTELETYHRYEIDRYDSTVPEYKAYRRGGKYCIKKI